jgi:hypothetical protein
VRRASSRMPLANVPLQTFRNPKPELLALLQESGAADANGVRNKDAAKKKNRRDKNVDMEKLADGLQKLSEDDLLHVVTLVHDNKTSETYTKNDVESMLLRPVPIEETLTSRRRRVSRRPLHAARFAGQDAMGLHGPEDRLIDVHLKSVAVWLARGTALCRPAMARSLFRQ